MPRTLKIMFDFLNFRLVEEIYEIYCFTCRNEIFLWGKKTHNWEMSSFFSMLNTCICMDIHKNVMGGGCNGVTRVNN